MTDWIEVFFKVFTKGNWTAVICRRNGQEQIELYRRNGEFNECHGAFFSFKTADRYIRKVEHRETKEDAAAARQAHNFLVTAAVMGAAATAMTRRKKE